MSRRPVLVPTLIGAVLLLSPVAAEAVGPVAHDGTPDMNNPEHVQVHVHPSAPPADHPVGLLLGGFGAVNGAVLVGAAVVRRRERAARAAKSARRSAGRATPAPAAEAP